jgi:hypothetical protein
MQIVQSSVENVPATCYFGSEKNRAAFSVNKSGTGADLSFPFGPELEATMTRIRKEAH